MGRLEPFARTDGEQGRRIDLGQGEKLGASRPVSLFSEQVDVFLSTRGGACCMDDQSTKSIQQSRDPGYDLRCSCCGDYLSLLHPHIVAERYDENENVICEDCWEKQRAATLARPLDGKEGAVK